MEVITTHLNADFDAMASMVMAKKLYPDAVCVFSGSQEKNLRDFFVESIHYYGVQRLKNINLDEITKLIIVDTRQPKRIGNFQQLLDKEGVEVHIFDHHQDAPGDIKGDYEVIRPVGSTSTILTDLFRKNRTKITPEEATILAMAIHEDTGSFTFDSTTADDLKAMAWLLKKGADLHKISQFVAKELTTGEVSLLHELIRSATTYTIRGIDIVVAKISVPDYVDEFAMLVRRFLVMENLNTLFAIARMDDRIYLIARSRIPEVNVGKIALDFGGGGHASAASATIKNMTLIEAEEKLIQLLHKHVSPESFARDLMSSPVISVKPDVPIKDANQTLTRYNITVLPVFKDKKKILGLISRRVVEKAIFHGLGDLPVSEYMSTDFVTLPPSSSLSDIEELIIEHRQRFIPVVSDKGIMGVITRTDLLNLLVNDPARLPKNLLSENDQPSTERNRNLNSLMVEALSRDIIILLRTIGEVAKKNNCAAYAVGGFVRDLLLHVDNLDLDIVIEGDGVDFARKLAAHLGGEVRIHEKFSTAVVKLPDGFKIDVATARLEYYAYPAAMPTVELSSIKLDLYRRDFTVNAMAIHLNPEKFGIMVDFFNCQSDLKDRQIRILHNLSFVEDPTRIFRAIRFEQRMGFTLGKHTEKLIKNAVRMDLFNRFSGRRFFGELQLILSEEDPLPAINRLNQFNLLKFLSPTLKLDQRLKHILDDTQKAIAWHKLLYLNEPCQLWMVYLLALTARTPMNEVLSFCINFEVPEKYRQILIKEKSDVYKIDQSLHRRTPFRASEAYWLLHDLSHEGVLYLMGITKKKSAKKLISHYFTTLRHMKTFTTGAVLKKMGYPAGPIYRTILNHVLEAKLDGLVKTRKEERSMIKELYPLADYAGKPTGTE
ncbi:MAG: CBS domain-containing protein [Proteobacteria bacterium]|nr:CBS domain-containing protein [Pseudomonadota bacterium]MBU1710734.1 CBS domain-containing protein [Pseudomonadota bacterium]